MATNNYTAQSLVLDLLRYVGVIGFAPADNDAALNQPGLDDDDIRRAITAINSGLQTIQKWGPQSMKEGKRSCTYLAPASLVFGVTNGSKTAVATPTAAPPAWMKGCSILLEGDADLNRIMAISGTTPFPITLLRGYLGPTNAAAGATIYSDCASLDADVQTVVEPVSITPNVRLHPAQDIDDFERFRSRWWTSYGWPWSGGTVYPVGRNPGTPVRYIVERQRDGTPFLRVTPMPAQAINVTFQAKLRAERITAALAINQVTPYTDPQYVFTSLHDDEVESLLVPISRWRFFTHPALKNAETRASVKLEYDEAMLTLKNGITLEPAVIRTRARFI